MLTKIRYTKTLLIAAALSVNATSALSAEPVPVCQVEANQYKYYTKYTLSEKLVPKNGFAPNNQATCSSQTIWRVPAGFYPVGEVIESTVATTTQNQGPRHIVIQAPPNIPHQPQGESNKYILLPPHCGGPYSFGPPRYVCNANGTLSVKNAPTYNGPASRQTPAITLSGDQWGVQTNQLIENVKGPCGAPNIPCN